MTFNDLGLIEPILRAVNEKGYDEPTPIQAQAIPHVLAGKDVIGCAQTGTGKTAAFSIPIIQRTVLHEEEHGGGFPYLTSLIISPTRELASQIGENIEAYAKHTPIKHAVIYGGVHQKQQVEAVLGGIHMLVATPGRLLDLMGQGIVHIDMVETLVLDEADRMLDMGFIDDIRTILREVPDKRQTLFFSATMPPEADKLARTILTDPVRVEVAPQSTTAETIQQLVYHTDESKKLDLLVHILDQQKIKQGLVFVRTKRGADELARALRKRRIRVAAIHGNKDQKDREWALLDLKENKIRLLIATDIASRGIDIRQLQHVINYDVPREAESYVHRIGRSGRAGEEGTAITICTPRERKAVGRIEQMTGTPIEVVTDHPFPASKGGGEGGGGGRGRGGRNRGRGRSGGGRGRGGRGNGGSGGSSSSAS